MAEYPLPPFVDELFTPALCIWESHVRSNIARVVELLDGEVARWRPHVKTTKLPHVWRLLFEAGVQRTKCATTRELDQLLATARSSGLARFEVLYAMPPVGPAAARLAELAQAYPEYQVAALVEDVAGVRALPSEVGIFVDLATGLRRTGAVGDARAVVEAAGERLLGLHAYDGHQHGPEPERTRSVHAEYAALLGQVQAFEADGIQVPEVVTSGTPAFLSALTFRGLHDPPARRHTLSPGTVVFHDVRSEEDTSGLGLVPAALVLTRVLSHPAPGRFTLDAGSKALGADADGPIAAIHGQANWRVADPSEEHLTVDSGGERPARGEHVLAIPRHVCTTVNLHDEVLWIEPSGAARSIRVSARGHELFAPTPTRFV